MPQKTFCHFQELYIHVPFCTSKCDYCAFYSLSGVEDALVDQYLGKLRSVLLSYSSHLTDLHTIYIGGGTPTSLSEGKLSDFFLQIRTALGNPSPLEWTIECNPESLTSGKFETLASSGITRVSLGIQSLRLQHRKLIGRHGDVPDVEALVASVQHVGIRRISVDLIYGIPGQTTSEWENDLRRILDTGITHLSAYALSIEEGTALSHRLKPRTPQYLSDERDAEMWELTEKICSAYGLERYEVSNYARPGQECQHNMAIWHGATYLGCGPAACSFDGTLRWSQPGDLQIWLQGSESEKDIISPSARAAEILAFGMRTTAGWDLAAFERQTGFNALLLRERELEELMGMGLLVITGNHVVPTRKGLLFNDTVMQNLI